MPGVLLGERPALCPAHSRGRFSEDDIPLKRQLIEVVGARKPTSSQVHACEGYVRQVCPAKRETSRAGIRAPIRPITLNGVGDSGLAFKPERRAPRDL